MHARQELGPEYDEALLDAFLTNLERRIDLRIESLQRVENKKSRGAIENPAAVVAPSFALAIPLIAIAGGIAGGFGIAAVAAALVLVNVLYFIDRWVRLN